MLDKRILGLIELHPNGVTNGQLLWRLNAGGTRYDAAELLAALDRLAYSGDIRSDTIRWRSTRTSGRLDKTNGRPPQRNLSGDGSDTGVLRAAPARVGLGPFQTAPLASDAYAALGAAPSAEALLRYYAATQRRDPRGTVEAFPDGHGVKWHLFDCHGRWWEGHEVVIPAPGLCPAFLQALAETGREGSAAVGWPVSVFTDSTGGVCVPGFLMPASWRLEDDRLTFAVDAVQPALNPSFTRHVRRLTGLSEDALLRAMEAGEDGASLQVLSSRFAHLLAKIGGQGLRPSELASEISLKGEAVRNGAALFLPDEASFTRRVAEDLDRIAEWPASRREATALNALMFRGAQTNRQAFPAAAVVEIDKLTERQFIAADAALSAEMTAIQGPPGTGKSQTIVTLICSALAAQQNALFVARNHRALDEVERRLNELLPGSKVMVRARDADGERDTSMLDVLVELANGQAASTDEVEAAGDRRKLLVDAALKTTNARRVELERLRIHLALADLVEREEDLIAAYAAVGARTRKTRRLFDWLLGLVGPHGPDPLSTLPSDARPQEVRHRIVELRARLAALPELPETMLPDIRRQLPALARAIEVPDEGTLTHLRTRKSEIDFERGGPKTRHMTAEDARILLRHRPIWAASTLSVPARIPLAPGLFDLAIFDEASQCDIASALPILARAKRAVIVGDPEQLSFIPSLGNAQEHALMDAVGLPRAGRAAWAQSRNSLFDCARARIGADRLHLLPDQFRSAPDIVDYTSKAFYGGRLRARRSDDEFSPPRGYRPGLHWQDVRGPCAREDGGNINRAEADWVSARIASLAREDDFEGSVGVISPFNAQVGLIRRLVERGTPIEARERMSLIIDTVDGWQGGEADVILFSLAVGPTATHSAVAFLSRERRRFNVAVSRARAVAVIVGDLSWARSCGIAHVAMLADRAIRPQGTPQRGFDSKWERRVHEALKARGLDPKPQYPVGSRSLDFALFQGEVRLDLEVDGRKWHTGAGGERKTADRLRDRELMAKGWKVRRFWVDELARDMEGCLDIVERDLGSRA